VSLLKPHQEYLVGRGFRFPGNGDAELDYQKLAEILINPDENLTCDLGEALYTIDQLSRVEYLDDLLEMARARDIDTGPGDVTTADLAVRIWLNDRRALERLEGARHLDTKKRFEYFRSPKAGPGIPPWQLPDDLSRLDRDLSAWFEARKRGRGAKVFAYPSEDEVYFLIAHGLPYCRVPSHENGQLSSVFFRPGRHDLVVYSAAANELRVNATTAAEMDLYVEQFGLHLFGAADYFACAEKYTLEPLRQKGRDALQCADIEGIEAVKLHSIEYDWGVGIQRIEADRGADLFDHDHLQSILFPEEPRILRVRLEIRFARSRKSKVIGIRPPNIVEYNRGTEAPLVDELLQKRGLAHVNGRCHLRVTKRLPFRLIYELPSQAR